MAWPAYYSLDGSEIINGPRTEAYARAAGVSWFRPYFKNDDLAPMLGHAPYRSPLQDDAPWADVDHPESYDFLGFYPLDITGIEDSTRTATVTESTLDGGLVGRVRHGTRTVVFNGILIGLTEEAVEYGVQWLKIALLGGPCSSTQIQGACGGGDLCYLSAEPCLDSGCDPADCLDEFTRSLRKFAVYNGPTVTAKATMADGSRAWTVGFTGTAGVPWEYGAERQIIKDFMVPGNINPWAPGITGGTFDPDGTDYAEVDCTVKQWGPLYDAACLPITPPPAPPDVPLGCYTKLTSWTRRQVTIPADQIPLWGEVVPVIEVRAQAVELRNLRLRFYADVFGSGDPTEDPCAYCGDIVFSYVPLNTTLTFDAVTQTVYATDPGGVVRRADALVFDTDGKPFNWPSLSCGFGYIVTFDLPQTQVPPAVDLALVPRAA